MKTIKIKFNVSTRYVGSDVSEVIEFDIDDDMTEKEIEELIEEEFETWVWENINAWHEIIE